MGKKSKHKEVLDKISEMKANGKGVGHKVIVTNITYDFDSGKYIVNKDFGKQNGKQLKRTKSFDAVEEAVACLEQHLEDIRKKKVLVPKDFTLIDYCRYWHNKYIWATENNKGSYERMIRLHIAFSSIASCNIQDIKPDHVAILVRELQTQDNSKKPGNKLDNITVNKVIDALHHIFQDALENEVVYRNPVLQKHRLPVTPKDIEAFDIEEVKAIIKASSQLPIMHRSVIQLALFTGLRKGELAGLKWKYVDLENRFLMVREQRQGSSKKTINALKTKTSYRSVDLSTDAIELLTMLKKRYKINKELFGSEFQDLDFVICYDDGSICTAQHFSKLWNDFVAKNEFRSLPFKDLRHTYGTMLKNLGVNPFEIKEQMGHSRIETTERYYIKPYMTRKTEAMEKIDKALANTQEIPVTKGEVVIRKDAPDESRGQALYTSDQVMLMLQAMLQMYGINIQHTPCEEYPQATPNPPQMMSMMQMLGPNAQVA